MEKLRIADEMASLTKEYLDRVEKSVNPDNLAKWKEAESLWKANIVDITKHNGLDNPYEPPEDACKSSLGGNTLG